MGDYDRAKHKAEEAAGTVKRKYGEATDDPARQAEGTTEEAKGKAKQGADDAAELAKDAAERIKDKARRTVNRDR